MHRHEDRVGAVRPIPITLSAHSEPAAGIKVGREIALTDPDDGSILATMRVTEKYAIDKDARGLARTLAGRSPLERPGDLALLRRHERSRRADVDAMQFFTDRLEWLFGLVVPLAAAARNAGLRAVDAAPWAKRLLAAHAMR